MSSQTMTSFNRLMPSSLRNRMLLIFLLLLSVIVLVTLYTVQSATYSHSTGQVLAHAKTSASVVKDKIQNQADLLVNTLDTLSKDFSTKQLVASARNDSASLRSALMNHQRRISSDITWVLDPQGQLLASTSNNQNEALSVTPALFHQGTIRWLQLGEQFYLVKSAPIKFVESSRQINAWVFMGILASGLINQELVELTDMQINLFLPEAQAQLLGSSMQPEQQSMLQGQTLSLSSDLHNLLLGDEELLYTTTTLGLWQDRPIYLLLSTEKHKAYLSYNSLLGQLIGILFVAALMALVAAMLLSKGITGPIIELVQAARKIRQGKYVKHFPSSSTNEVSTLSLAISDMQKGIKKREEEIHQLAFYDELTGLPNRTQFTSHIQELIAAKDATKTAVLMMDIDRFKDINDTVGHEVGDLLLKEVAKRLQTFTSEQIFCASIGGDEFGIVIQDFGETRPELLAEDIASIFERPFNIDQLNLDMDASIGIAVYPYDAETVAGLVQCADIALYSCKGKHYSYAVYKPELNKHSVQRLSLMSELREALAEGQLQLYYQPKLSIAENKITTVECLIRWIHPTHGFINPDDFIPLAEQTGAIRDVTSWGLNVALRQQKKWRQAGHNIGVAVNISALDLVDMKLPAYVSELMSKYGTQANMLTLEVTESAIMSDPENAIKALSTLQRMGIILSIDDFGTGYSSMAQLKKMPVDELKIDKAFVLDVAKNTDDQIMVKTMVSLAQNLSLTTVAEGVEDKASLEFLASIGCTKAQGYYLSKPIPADQFDQWHQGFIQAQQESVE